MKIYSRLPPACNRLAFLSGAFYLIFNLFFSFLNSQEHQKWMMNNPTFWQWNLPSGSYAIHYIEKGSGPRHVLLLHGFAAYSFTWKALIDDLAKGGYHVWSMDLIGSGLSDKPNDVPYGLTLFTQQIEAFMQSKQIDQASLVGNSMGGGLALAMSIVHPNRVKSLVLIDALAFSIKLPLYFAITKTLGTWTKPLIGRTMIKQILKQVMYNPNKISEEQIQAYEFPFRTPGGKDAFIKTLQNFDAQELENMSLHFKNIHVPVLIIWGEKDSWMPLNYFQRLSHAFPQATTVVIPNCGHISQEECPQKVSQALLQFFKKNE